MPLLLLFAAITISDCCWLLVAFLFHFAAVVVAIFQFAFCSFSLAPVMLLPLLGCHCLFCSLCCSLSGTVAVAITITARHWSIAATFFINC